MQQSTTILPNNNTAISPIAPGVAGNALGGGAGSHPSLAQLVQSLKTRDLSAQLYALTQLKILSSSNPRFKDTIREYSAIQPTVTLLSSTDQQVQQSALALLRSLSVNESNQRAIADAGAIPLLYQCLQQILHSPSSATATGNNSSTDVTMQVDAAATLWNLACDPQNKQTIAETNGIVLLLSVLSRTKHAGLASEICGALRNLAHSVENLHSIVEFDGGIALIANLLKADTERTQKNAAITLNLCLQHPLAADQIEEIDCFDLLARLLRKFEVPLMIQTGTPYPIDAGARTAPANMNNNNHDAPQTTPHSLMRRNNSTAPVSLQQQQHNRQQQQQVAHSNLLNSMVQGQQWVAAQQQQQQHYNHNRNLQFSQRMNHPAPTTAIAANGANGANGNELMTTTTAAPISNNGNSDCFGTIAWSGLELGAKLGEGAFGVVYSAKYHDYTVAVKIVHEELTNDAAKRDKLMFESRLLSMLHHPNVLLLLGTSITPDSRPVVVTEYCSMGTLKDVMAETASVLRRLQFARDIINGLNWLHAHNVVHRDLKPVNVLIDEHYRAKVADFGLSLLWFDGITCTGFKGNVKFSANELLAARADPNCRSFPYGPQTDIYSFGLMLWELVTNQPLFPEFRGKTAKNAITRYVCAGNRPPMTPGWPRALQTMLTQCWHQDPTQRPKIGAVKRDFQQVLVDLICPDRVGRKVARTLWLGQETRRVPYEEFERVFTDTARVDLGTASFCYRRCLSAMLCDSFDNTITFERFCNMLHYFDSLTPIDAFLSRLITLFDQPWFFGFVPAEDARAMLIEHWKQTRQPYYMMRFSSNQPGSYSLFAIDAGGVLTHWRIGHLYSSEFFIPIDENFNNHSNNNSQQQQQQPQQKKGGPQQQQQQSTPQTAFKDLIALHAHCLQLPSMLKGKNVMPGSPCQCFFASNPLAASADN